MSGVHAAPQRSPFGKWMLPAVAAVAVLAIGVAAWALWPTPAPTAASTRFQVELPEDVTFNSYVSMSPDGRKLLFNATGENSGLWIRDLDTLEWRHLAGTEAARSPFWSPDSQFLGFAVGNQLKKIDVAGGPPQTLADSSYLVGTGTWNRDGTIVFGMLLGPVGLSRVSQSGGVPTPVTTLDTARGEIFHALPTFMPDGNHFIYLRQGPPEVRGIYGGSLDTLPEDQSNKRILVGQFAASYVNGYLFFMRDNTLMGQPFDADAMQLTGEPIPVVEQVATTGSTGVFSVSPSGALAYRAGSDTSEFVQTWFDRQGRMLETFGQENSDRQVRLSPDGTRGVIRDAALSAEGDLWTLDFARGLRTRFTFRQSIGSMGVWSPDGSRIVFTAGILLDTLFEKASTGAAEEIELFKDAGKIHVPTSWSQNGRFLLYNTVEGSGAPIDQFVLPLEGDRTPVALLNSEFGEGFASFSPDMRWIAYASDESGRPEVYVRPFNAAGPAGVPSLGQGKWQVSRDGGTAPRWRADGKEIFFDATANGPVKMAVEVTANGSVFEPGIPRQLFEIDSAGWDVTGDGQRFLLSVPTASQSARNPITVVLNWQALLEN